MAVTWGPTDQSWKRFQGGKYAREGSEDWSEGERRNRGKEGICGEVSDGREIKRRKLAMGVA